MAPPPDSSGASVSERIEQFFDRGPTWRGLYSLAQGMKRHNLALAASAMSFDFFLALIPMLALAGWFASRTLQHDRELVEILSTLMNLTPVQIRDVLMGNFERYSAAGVAPLALAGSFWLASSAFHTLMNVFEEALQVTQRSWWAKRAIALAFVGVSLAALLASAASAVWVLGGPAKILDRYASGVRIIPETWRTLAAVVLVVGATTFLALFFRVAVHRPGVRHRVVWPGALVSVTIAGLASVAFATYSQTISRVALYYGSLAAVAVLLTWLYLVSLAMLIGAELNGQLECEELRTLPMSTRTPARPRRAVVDGADLRERRARKR